MMGSQVRVLFAPSLPAIGNSSREHIRAHSRAIGGNTEGHWRIFAFFGDNPSLFGTTLEANLAALGHGVSAHFRKVQTRRNDFGHGNASAIDDPPVRETVERLHEVQEAVIVALFNLSCAGNPGAPSMWRERERKDRGR